MAATNSDFQNEANNTWNDQYNNAQQNNQIAQNQVNQSNAKYNNLTGADTTGYNSSRADLQQAAQEQQQNANEISGKIALDTANQQIANYQKEAGFNEDLNRNAMQNVNQAVGNASAYNDLLNTSGYNFGQNAGARAAAESNAESGINNNINAQQNVLNGQQTAFTNGANVGNTVAQNFIAGNQAQSSDLANMSTSEQALLAQANAKYQSDIQAWLGAANAATQSYGQASNAIGTGARAINDIMQSEAANAQATLLTPAQTREANARAGLESAEQEGLQIQNQMNAWQFQVSKDEYATKLANGRYDAQEAVLSSQEYYKYQKQYETAVNEDKNGWTAIGDWFTGRTDNAAAMANAEHEATNAYSNAAMANGYNANGWNGTNVGAVSAGAPDPTTNGIDSGMNFVGNTIQAVAPIAMMGLMGA